MSLALLEKELNQLMKTPHGRRAFMASVPLLLASCATQEKHRYREGNNAGQATEMTVADEQKMTKEYLPQMRKEYPPTRDRRMQNYIQNLGHKVVKANGLGGRPYKYNFTVVDAKFVNAFALPAGEVFVTTPLLAMAETEAELAGVVGHEIGHVVARHSAERIDQAKKSQSKSLLWGAIGGLLGGAAGFGLGKLLCSKQDRECLKRAAMYGAMAGAGGGLLIQKFAFMANSREDEMEADRIGFKTSYRAGYSKEHIGRFYEKLLQMEKAHKKGQNVITAKLADVMSTHPPGEERVVQMRQMAAKTPANQGIVSSVEFDRIRSEARRRHPKV